MAGGEAVWQHALFALNLIEIAQTEVAQAAFAGIDRIGAISAVDRQFGVTPGKLAFQCCAQVAGEAGARLVQHQGRGARGIENSCRAGNRQGGNGIGHECDLRELCSG